MEKETYWLERETKQIKLVRKVLIIIPIAIIAIILLFGSWYTVDVEHDAVVSTFGKAAAVTDPGLHFKIPLIQHVKKVDTTIHGLAIGYDLNTNENIDDESVMISSDYNFVNVDFYLEYSVTDPIAYIYASDKPEEILKAVTQNCIRTVIASYPVDAVLTTGKSEIQSNIKSMLMTKTEEVNIGITVRNITIQDSEPPTASVNEAFKAVETAKQGKETAVNNANKYRNEQIPAAEAEADKILQNAEATKAERIAEAEGQVARFNSMYEEYVKYPDVTRERMFYETMEDVLPNLKIIISGKNGTVNTMLPLDSFANISNNSVNESNNQ